MMVKDLKEILDRFDDHMLVMVNKDSKGGPIDRVSVVHYMGAAWIEVEKEKDIT